MSKPEKDLATQNPHRHPGQQTRYRQNRNLRYLVCICLPFLLFSCSDETGESLRMSGLVEANTIRVSARTPGLVTSLRFEEGQTVQQGDVLLTIETDKLDFQTEQSRAALVEAENTYKAAASELKAATIRKQNLEEKVNRFSSLLESNAVTRQQVDDLKSELEAAEEQLNAASSSLKAIGNRKQQIASGLQIITKQINDATLVAPSGGTILVRYTDQGELLGTGTPVCEIADLGKVWTRIFIEETRLPEIRIGQKMRISVDGLDSDLSGTVTWISDRAEFTPKAILTEETRTSLVFPAKVSVENTDGLLKIGMPVTVFAKRDS